MAQHWSSNSAAPAFAHGIFYGLIRGGGRWAAYALLVLVATWYTLCTGHGQRGRFYLARRFPGRGAAARLWHRWRLNFTFGLVLVDRAAAGILGDRGIVGAAREVARLNDLLARRRGVLILSAHVGGWQIAMAALEHVRAEKFVVYRRPAGDVDKLAHEHADSATTLNFIDPTGPDGGALGMLAALQRNAVVCVTGDRPFDGRNTVSVPFLGGVIRVPAAVYRIAAATGAPLAVMFFPRRGPGRFAPLTLEVFTVADRGRELANYRPEAARFAAALEKFCADYCYQFFNFYDLWEK
ncbi:MAG: lysophospholipid acyltransferase family protein [Verrucomicrobiales bacterium]|jgi:predicted LPLAT superfamily acyltransferase|nr:lysophospholipid acyltransferase family protein [Verrucomicrobiales bacterium]